MTKLLTPQQVADQLGVKLATIYCWTHLRKIPHVKLGRLLRFRESEIEQWISSLSKRKSKFPRTAKIGRNDELSIKEGK